MSSTDIHRSKGFALILVLWAVVLLSVIAASFLAIMQTESALAAHQVQSRQASALADAGVELAVLALKRSVAAEDDTDQWQVDGTEYELELETGTVFVRVIAERGKLDLNTASEDLVRAVIGGLATEDGDQLADRVLDWRDADDDPRPDGAEDEDYERQGLAYEARDGAFVSLAELDQVFGITAEESARIAEVATIFSRKQRINALTAPREVLLAIPGLDEPTVDAFIEQRRQSFEANLPPPTDMLPEVEDYLYFRQDAFPRPNGTYTIIARGVSKGGTGLTKRAIVRLRRSVETPYTIHAWSGSDTAKALPEPDEDA